MTNRSQQIGTEFETLFVPYLRPFFSDSYPELGEDVVHRLGKQGRNDKGDLWIPDPRHIIECKREKRMNLAGWIKEAEDEAVNAGKPYGVVFHKRVKKGQPQDQWATMLVGTFMELAYGQR